MASTNPGKATFIYHKLKFLKDQGDHLISTVGQYVNKIITAGDSWTQGGGNNVEFQELCHMIDTAALLLCEKREELADLSSQSITTASSTPATSDRQPAVPLDSTATTSYRQPTESVQPADEARMKPILDRISVMEEAMCSFRSRTEKVAEQQSGIDQQLKELLSKLSESDKKHSSRFEQAKQQISDINETRDAIEQEQKTRLQSLEKQLQEISTAQKGQKAEMEFQTELIEILAHVSNLLESVEEKVVNNTQTVQLISEVQTQNTTLLRELETRMQTLKADGGRNVKDVQKQAEKVEENLYQEIQDVAVMSPRLQQLEAKSPGTRCGFTAWTWLTEVAENTIIKQYKTTNCNVGENFNADSGIFTAPVDGLYVAVISIMVSENEHLRVGVRYKRRQDQETSNAVCASSAATKQTTVCDVGVVDMKAGGVLFTRVGQYKKNNCDKLVTFSCFLLR